MSEQLYLEFSSCMEDTETDMIRFETKIYNDDEEIIGRAIVNYYDATKYHYYIIRMMAQIDGQSACEFQTLSSVRIFEDDEQRCAFERGEFVHEELPLKENDIFSFTGDELESIKSFLEYDENTINIFGKFISVEDIELNDEFNTYSNITIVLEKIEGFFKNFEVGFILIMPWSIVKAEDEFTLKKFKKVFIDTLQAIDYKQTVGKLYNPCLVKELDADW